MSNNQRGNGNYGRGRQGRGRGSSRGHNPQYDVHSVYGTTPQGGDMRRNPTRGGRPYFRGSSNGNISEYRDQGTFSTSPQIDNYAGNTNRGGRPYFRGGRGAHIGHDFANRGRRVSNRGMGISNTSGGPDAGRNNESYYYQGNEGQMPTSMPREQMSSPYYNNTYTQSPPMNMMPGQEEVITTHTVRRYVNTQVPQPSHLVPQPSHFIQPPSHLVQPPTHLVPPPPLITRQQQRSGSPAHNMMNRSQSEMNIPMHDINPSQRQRMHKQESNRRGSQSSSNNNLARSSSLQTIEKGWDDTGARPKDFQHMRNNRRNEHNQERPISSQQKGSAMINKSQEMLEDTSDNEQEFGNKRNANYRYNGRARGQRRGRKGHRVNNNVEERNPYEKTGRVSENVCNEAQDFESDDNEIHNTGHKERNRINRCNRPFKRNGATGRGNVEKMEQPRDVEQKTNINDKIGLERDTRRTTCEKNSERMSVGNRRRLHYNDSVLAKGNHYNGRNYNRLRRNIERKRCTDSESSVISGTSTVTDTDQLSKTDPVRAGVDGIDEISIQTLKNRNVRYKKKLNELKKSADPNQIKINELETTLEKLQRAIHSRVVKEKETTHQIESNKGKDTSESCMIDIENENEMDIKYRDDKKDKNQKVQHDRKHKFVATSKKTVVFRPKSKRASNFVTARIKRNSSDGLEIDSSDSDAYEDIDIVEEMPKTRLLGDKQTIKTNTVRNRSKGKHNSGGDWQTTLDDLCELDANIGSDSPFEIKIKEVKANNDVNIDSMEKKGKNKLNLGTATKEASCKSVVANKFSEGNLQNIGDSHIQNRKRSGSERSDSSVDIGPEEVEIFKYLVREMNGEGNPLTIKNKSGLFKSCNDMNGWFRKHGRKFNIFEKDNTIVNISVFVKDAEYCLDYITRDGCTKSECNRYHICKNLLCGDCKFGDHCKFSHDCLDTNNLTISTQLGFVGIFDNEQIISILSRRFPHVCENWNKTGSCEESSCSKLHLCQRHVFGNCLAGDVCPFEHTLSTTQNLMVTKAYRMSNWNPKIFNKLVFVPRTSTQFRRDVAESMKSNELDKESTKDKSGTNQRKPDVIYSRKSKVAQKRPERNTQFEDKNDDPGLFKDCDTKHIYLCDKQLEGKCDEKHCRNIHNFTAGLPYLWQIKVYGKWISLPEVQNTKIEEEFCAFKERSGTYILSCEDGLVQEYHVEFYPIPKAYIKPLDMDGGKQETDARRHSTPSYALGSFKEASFKTQWRWMWMDDRHNLKLFDTDKLQYTIEKKYITGQKKYMYSRENYRFKYCLDFGDMTQLNLDTGKSRKVFRRPVLVPRENITEKKFVQSLQPPPPVPTPLPEGWAVWDFAHPFELVELKDTLKQYKETETHFYKTLDRNMHTIDRIYRIQNPVLWSNFTNFKKSMAANAERAGHGRDVNEQMLFHGTDSLNTVRGIAINNFDYRLSGKNATVYGEGAYFAKTAKYSHSYTKPPERFMFLARVMFGEYTKGDRSYRRAPEKPGTSHELYDSCVDNVDNPSIHIVFDRNQYYPEFLIQYHSVDVVQPLRLMPHAPRIRPVATPAPTPPSPYTQAGLATSSPQTSYPASPSPYTQAGLATVSQQTSYPATPLSYPSNPSSPIQHAPIQNPPTKTNQKDASCVVQ